MPRIGSAAVDFRADSGRSWTRCAATGEAAFARYRSADKADLENELAKIIAGIEEAGLDPDDSPRVKERRAGIEDDAVDIDTRKAEVCDPLYRFFRRYDSDGDFRSKRVCKPPSSRPPNSWPPPGFLRRQPAASCGLDATTAFAAP